MAILDSGLIPVSLRDPPPTDCELLTSDSDLFILGLNDLEKRLRHICPKYSLVPLLGISLQCYWWNARDRCETESFRPPYIFNRFVLPFGLLGLVRQAMQTKCVKDLIAPVESLSGDILFVIHLKRNDKTPWICSDYLFGFRGKSYSNADALLENQKMFLIDKPIKIIFQRLLGKKPVDKSCLL